MIEPYTKQAPWHGHLLHEIELFNFIFASGGEALVDACQQIESWMFSSNASMNLWACLVKCYALTGSTQVLSLQPSITPTQTGLDAKTCKEVRDFLVSCLELETNASMGFGTVDYFASRVCANARKRMAWQACYEAQKKLAEDGETEQVMAVLQQQYMATQLKSNSRTKLTAEIEQDYLAEQNSPEAQSYFWTGVEAVDRIMIDSPITNGNLIILGARPAVGKTTFALTMAYHNARWGKKVLFLGYEMTQLECYKALKTIPMVSPMVKEADAMRIVRELPLSLNNDTRMANIEGIESLMNYQKLRHGLDIVFVDYLGLMNYPKEFKSRYEGTTYISQSLKRLAQKHNIPIVAVCQLSRNDNLAPELHHLRDSGAIEQDANKVFLLHKPEKDDKRKAIIYLAKNRSGATGEANVTHKLENSCFVGNVLGGLNRGEQFKRLMEMKEEEPVRQGLAPKMPF